MATGMSGLGGMYGGGMYGGGASMYSGVPYGLQPNVAADAAASSVMNNVTSNVWNNANEGQKYIENVSKDIWKNGVPATPVQSGGGGVQTTTTNTYGSSTNSSSAGSRSSSSSGTTCFLCHGIKKCWTCNGKQTYLSNGKYIKCPNCTDGLCSHCHGTGLK